MCVWRFVECLHTIFSINRKSIVLTKKLTPYNLSIKIIYPSTYNYLIQHKTFEFTAFILVVRPTQHPNLRHFFDAFLFPVDALYSDCWHRKSNKKINSMYLANCNKWCKILHKLSHKYNIKRKQVDFNNNCSVKLYKLYNFILNNDFLTS